MPRLAKARWAAASPTRHSECGIWMFTSGVSRTMAATRPAIVSAACCTASISASATTVPIPSPVCGGLEEIQDSAAHRDIRRGIPGGPIVGGAAIRGAKRMVTMSTVDSQDQTQDPTQELTQDPKQGPLPINPTSASLLGFLYWQPMSGGEIVAAVEASVGHFWNVTRSQIDRKS